MAGSTTKQQGPYPTGPDAPYVHLDLKALAEWSDGRLLAYCTEAAKPTGANRFLGAVALPTATDGNVSAQVWDGGAWRFLAMSSARMVQSGSAVIITNSAGGFNISFPIAFPTGSVPAVTVSDGDAGGGNINLVGVIYSQVGNTNFGGVVRSSSSSFQAVVSGAVRVNWVAAG